MNVENWINQHTIFECVAGSQAYGLATPTSDQDFRGFCIPPIEYFYGPVKFEQKDSAWEDGADRAIWNIAKGVEMMLNGNPNCIELLWMPEDCIVKTSTWWRRIQDLRSSFLSTRVKSSYLGYADQQWKRMSQDFQSPYKPKYASHLIRLLCQGIELLETGSLTVKMSGSDHQFCMETKLGKKSNEEILRYATFLMNDLKQAAEKTDLPVEPDRKKVYAELHDLLNDFYGVGYRGALAYEAHVTRGRI